MSFTNKEYWDNYWETETRNSYNFYFGDLLNKFIAWDKVHSYMEIGGAPGSVMAYMRNTHGTGEIATVDFTDKARTQAYLKSVGIDDALIINDDFSVFNVSEYRRRYDVVASWGFVEHFEKKITAEFIQKKKDMVSDEGYLIIELPNIRKLFWLSYWLFNRELIKIHNLEIMDLVWLENQVKKDNDFTLLYSSYYFAMNDQNEYFTAHPRMCKLCKKIVAFFRDRRMSNSVKSWFFPYIVIIAQRKKDNKL